MISIMINENIKRYDRPDPLVVYVSVGHSLGKSGDVKKYKEVSKANI